MIIRVNTFKDIFLFLTVLLILFAITSVMGSQVPLHSDDLFFSNSEVSLFERLQHMYMGWMGRLVVILTGHSLLNLSNLTIINIINSSALIFLIFFIVLLASQLTKKKIEPICFIYIFMIYWLANPSLGQTTFWICGSANYVWTNLFIVVFLNYFCYTYNSGIICKTIGFFLGIFAGCSLENTSIILVGIIIILMSYFKFKYRYPYKNGFPYLCGVLIGTSVLFAAPGNYRRLAVFRNQGLDWFDKNLFEKIYFHLTERSSIVLKSFTIIFVSFYIFISIALIKKITTVDRYFFSLLFFIAAFLSFFIMSMSVYQPIRTHNGQLFFLLISLSCIFLQIYDSSVEVKKYILILCIILCYLFGKLYFSTFLTYQRILTQSSIIVSTLENSLDRSKNISIPQFFYPRKDVHRFAGHNLTGMIQYFKLKNLSSYDCRFDYSILKNNDFTKRINTDFFSNIIIKNSNFFIPGTIILECTDKFSENIKHLSIKIQSRKRLYNIKITNTKPLEVLGKKYIGIQVEKLKVNCGDVVTIDKVFDQQLPEISEFYHKKCDGSIDSFVEEKDNFKITGWLVYSKTKQMPVRKIIAVKDDNKVPPVLFHTQTIPRPDVVKTLNAPSLKNSGFQFILQNNSKYSLGYIVNKKVYVCDNLTFGRQ